MSFLQTLQGGAVDKGGPVREATGQLLRLLANINELRRLRLESASEDSLVPVGDNMKVGFVTDEVRHVILQKKMAEEQRIKIQSNLKKSEGGFGGGYASKDGRAVVGAAHGIEEMIKMANISGKNASKFSDDGKPRQRTREEIILEDLKAEADVEKAKREAANASVDLLGSFAPAPAVSAGVDLLDFGGSSSTNTGIYTSDLLSGGMPSSSMPTASAPTTTADPFGLASPYNATTTAPTTTNLASSSLLDFSVQNDPFAPISATPNPPVHNNSTGLMGMSMNNPMMPSMQTPMQMPTSGGINDLSSGMNSMSLSAPPPKGPMAMAATSQDRFSALDALADAAPSQSQGTATDAEARLLGFSSAPAPSSSMGQPPMASMGMAPPPPIPDNMVAPGSGQVATAYGESAYANKNDDSDNPWVMGGATGMGLSAPSAPPPAAPPPPPEW